MSIKEEAIQLIDNMPDNEVVKVVAFIRGSYGKNSAENRPSIICRRHPIRFRHK